MARTSIPQISDGNTAWGNAYRQLASEHEAIFAGTLDTATKGKITTSIGARQVLIYTTGTGWPARNATGYVEWVDPTGSAPAPTAQSGDTVIVGTGTGAAAPTELLSAADQELTSTNWWGSAGTPTFDTTAGRITIPSGARAARSNIAVTVGATLKLTVTPTSGNTGTFEGWCDFYDASNTYLSSAVGTGNGTGATAVSGTAPVPANSHHVSIFMSCSAGTAVIDKVSLTQAV